MKIRFFKLISLLLILCFALSMFACGISEKDKSETESPEKGTAEETSAATVPDTDTPDETVPETVTETETETETGPVTDDPDGPESSALSPYFWHVRSDNGGELFMLGTMHIGDERILEIARKAQRYIDKCGALAVECDTDVLETDYSAMYRYLMALTYKDGTTVKDHLPEETYGKLIAFAREQGFYNPLYESYNLYFWSSIVKELIIDNYTDLKADNGVDDNLISYAKEKGYQLIEVESVDFQIGLLTSFSDELYRLQIESMLDDPEGIAEETKTLLEYYVSGADEMEEYLTEEMTEEEIAEAGYTEEQLKLFEDYNTAILIERNEGMAKKAIEMLESGQKVFYAVGLAHFVGEGGLVDLLTQAGYTVERITFGKDYLGVSI